ncbi:MAG: hypothetical protein IIB30_01435, partial [Chloroflexi bacterium]|nr:hypothetical protein [Chloroflexota bacterium]
MNNFDQVALLLLILVPLAGAAMTMFHYRDRPQDVWYFAVIVAGVALAISLYVFARYDYTAGGYQFERTYQWLGAPVDISLSLGIDGISAALILLNGIVLFGAVLISRTILHRTRDFFVLLLALGSGVFGVFAVQDLFFLFFFYELAVLPMYLLIGVWGSSTDFGTFLRTKEYGAMKLFLYLVGGSVLVWIGILAVYMEAADAGAETFSLTTLATFAEAGGFSDNFQN